MNHSTCNNSLYQTISKDNFNNKDYTVLSLFSGAGGMDLGFIQGSKNIEYN